MQCLILAGGLGTRMAAQFGDLPKTLIPVAGRPFADRQLTWLASRGIDDVVYALGHGADAVRAFVGDGSRWGVGVSFVDDGETPLGTGGAVRAAVDAGLARDGFFVLYGDSFPRLDAAAVWAAADGGAAPLMTVYRNRGRWDASNAVVAGGRVTLYEKGRADAARIGMDCIDYGLNVLTRETVLELVPAGRPADLADAFHALSLSGRLRAFEAAERFYEIGSPEGLAEFEAWLAARPDHG